MKKIIALAILLLVAGCSKLTLENYQQLKVGMAFSQVTAVIGDPAQCEEALGTRKCQWGDESRSIKVTFLADKAVLFSHQGLN